MSAEVKKEIQLEIAHLLFIDVVGYSKLLVNEQIELMQELNRIVRGTECFREAEASGKLIRLPTGDGMVLLFFRSPEQPVRCALEMSQALRSQTQIQLRMGIHSGPVNQVVDVNDQMNIAGAGINVGQRVMDCGDAGHILLSKHVADDLTHYRHWQSYLHDLGECDVKHGLRLHVFNLYRDGLDNPAVPEKLRRGKRWKRTPSTPVRPVSAPAWPKLVLIITLLLAALARQLGVAHIVEGNVQNSGDAVRVNVQLIKAANDSHLWADTFDRGLRAAAPHGSVFIASWRNESEVRQPNKVLRKCVKTCMKKIGAIIAAALLSPYAVGSADAAGPLQEGPLHWTARHVRQAAVETGDTLSNVARTTGRTIHHGTRAVHQAFR
jgi:class 3 adenylate cyclase